MSRNRGLASFSANFEAQLAAPIDARMLVGSKADLVLSATWTANDGSIYAYLGMLVVVAADPLPANNGAYVLLALPYTVASNWDKVGGASSNVSTVVLGAAFATNQAFKLVAGVAQPVTSADVQMPMVDGIILESGGLGDTVPAAMAVGTLYTTPLALPPGSPLFLGQDGKPSASVPTGAAGDLWYITVMHQSDSAHFTFSPSLPIRIL